MAGIDELRWARRVRPEKIRRLYALDAKGIIDEELIDDVGYAMFARCESIRIATRAHAGKATCARCRSKIEHNFDKAQVLACDCGWQTTWGEYHKAYQGKQLHGGGAYPFFRAFIDAWPAARTPRDKLLAIDALIHACHGQFKGYMGRPAACNLIEGTARELVRFLDELAYGDQSTAELRATRDRWQSDVRAAPIWRGAVDPEPKQRPPVER
jgi:hypothetical protein